jgi:hypothetical protein
LALSFQNGDATMAAQSTARLGNNKANYVSPQEQITEDSPSSLLEQRIRDRAHAIYLERDGRHGTEVDDWLQAEKEIMAERGSEIQRD